MNHVIPLDWLNLSYESFGSLFGRSFLLHAVSRSDVNVVISGWLFSGTNKSEWDKISQSTFSGL